MTERASVASEHAPKHAPMLIGHRGAPGYRPEHTRASYLLAFDQGVDAVEPDLVVSKDGVLVIRHDTEISETTNVADHPEFADRRTSKVVDGIAYEGWFVEDFTWAELSTLRCRERIPQLRPLNTRFDGREPMLRFRDLLQLIDEESERRGREFNIVIELKHVQFLKEHGHDLVELLLGELAESGWDGKPGRVTIECFELDPLERLRESGVPAWFIFLLEHKGAPADQLALHGKAARSYEWFRSDAGLDSLMGRVHGISPDKRDLLKVNARGKAIGITDLVERAHARGLRVFTWTLRPENRFLTPGYRQGSERASWGEWREEWRLILSTGLDGVFLDHPDMLKLV